MLLLIEKCLSTCNVCTQTYAGEVILPPKAYIAELNLTCRAMAYVEKLT